MACKENACLSTVYAKINKALYESKTGADVTFKLADGELHAHKWFLIERLGYFRAMFKSGMKEATTGEVDVSEFDHSTWDQFLRYIYYGERPAMARQPAGNEAFSNIALRYDVPDLFNVCVDSKINIVNNATTVETWLKRVEGLCKFLDESRETISGGDTWATRIKAIFGERMKANLRRKMLDLANLFDDSGDAGGWLGVPPPAEEKMEFTFSGLESANIYDHADRLLASVLIGCHQEWLKDLLLPICYIWATELEQRDFPLEALGVEKEKDGIRTAWHACAERFASKELNEDDELFGKSWAEVKSEILRARVLSGKFSPPSHFFLVVL